MKNITFQEILNIILSKDKINIDTINDFNLDNRLSILSRYNNYEQYFQATNNLEDLKIAIVLCNVLRFANNWFDDDNDLRDRFTLGNLAKIENTLYNTRQLLLSNIRGNQVLTRYSDVINGLPSISGDPWIAEQFITDNLELVYAVITSDTVANKLQYCIVALNVDKNLLGDEILYQGEGIYYIDTLTELFGKISPHNLTDNKAIDRFVRSKCKDSFIKLNSRYFILPQIDAEKLLQLADKAYTEKQFNEEFPNCNLH